MSIKGEFCVFILLVSTFLASSRPHHRSKRSIVKDYLNPLTYPTAAVQFEKGQDGKYHAHLIDSKVEYALSQNLENLNGIAKNVVEPTDSAGTDFEKQKEVARDVLEEIGKAATDIAEKQQVEDTAKDATKMMSGILTDIPIDGFGSETGIKARLEETDKKSEGKAKTRYSLVKQEDHKMQFLPKKPDGKDDQPYEMQETPMEEYLPQPPLAPEPEDEKKEPGIGKLVIGQIPFFSSLPFFGSSVFLPDHSLSFRVQSRLPLPPAMAVQDRLPMLDDAEVMEEGSETAVVENVDPESGMVIGEKRTVVHRFSNPLGPGFTFPLVHMKKSIKELMDGQTLQEKSKAQIVDVMGKKMLFQNKVMKYPTDDSSRMYVGVMSVRPVDEVDPETLKKLGVEKEARGKDNTHRETEDKMQEEKSTFEKPILSSGVDKVPINLFEEMEGLGFVVGRHSKADVLKVEKSKLDEKSEVSDAVVSQANGITSTSKETAIDDETKEVLFRDGDSKANGISKKALDVEDKVNRSNFEAEETNAKKSADFETEKPQGLTDKKKLCEADDVKKKTLTENKVKNKYEVEKDSGKDSMAVSDISNSKKKGVEESKDEAEDSKSIQNDVAAKGSETVPNKEENTSTDGDSNHKLDQSAEIGDKKEKFEFNAFNESLEEKDIKVEDIDLTNIDGLLFADSKKKRFDEESREMNKKKTKSRKWKGSEERDSDSEDED